MPKLENAGQYLDELTKKNLNAVKKYRLGNKYDYVVLIVADKTGVGLGKSVLFHELCAYMDPDNFTVSRVFFDAMDFRMEESKLKPMQAFGFDEPDAFFSTEAMTRNQRQMKLKFTKIRQKMHFIVICAPSLFYVSKWVRGIGSSRVNCVMRVVRRGVFYAYGDRTGAIDRIKMDRTNNKIIWPESDFIGFFKKIPEKSEWWKAYTKKKNGYLKQADENPKAVKMMKKQRMKMQNAFTLRNLSEIYKVSIWTARQWYKKGAFGKRGSFIGVDGKVYIKAKALPSGMKKIRRWKEREIARRGKRGKDKKKRKYTPHYKTKRKAKR